MSSVSTVGPAPIRLQISWSNADRKRLFPFSSAVVVNYDTPGDADSYLHRVG